MPVGARSSPSGAARGVLRTDDARLSREALVPRPDHSATQGLVPPDISRRIACLRYVLIVAVVMVHIPPPTSIGLALDSAFEFVRAFFRHGLGRVAVPTLTCISGYLVFLAGADRIPVNLVARKAKTLAVPFLVWNVGTLAILQAAASAGLLGPSDWYHAYFTDAGLFFTKTVALAGVPANPPLYFLRDLFVLALLAPLIGRVLRRAPWAGLVVVFGLFSSSVLHPLLLQHTMAISFYVGGMAAVLGWDLRRLDAMWPAAAMLLGLTCIAIVVFQVTDLLFLRLVAPFLVWPIGGALASSRLGGRFASWSAASFLIYMAHAPVLRVMSRLHREAPEWIAYPLFWLAAPVATIALCHWLLPLAQRFAPRATRVALGERVGFADERDSLVGVGAAIAQSRRPTSSPAAGSS